MYKNNKDIGWEKPKGNGENGSYDDSLIKSKINEIDKELKQLKEDIENDENEVGNFATEDFVRNEIEKAQLDGGDVDLSGYATKDELNTKADVEDIPTKVSQLENDSNYLTSIPSEYITETELNDKGYLTEHQNISGKADKSYVDTELATKSDTSHTHDQYLTEHQDISGKANKSDIPTKTSQLTNDSGFITEVPSEYITETELNDKGYLTEHQDISGKVDKINGKGLSTNDYTTEEKNKLNRIEENANNYSLPMASSTVLGGIKVGNGLSIDSNGVLSSNTSSLESNTLTFGNYTITYNETDDTLDFIYNGVIEEPVVSNYVSEGLSLYIDTSDEEALQNYNYEINRG